MPAVEVAVVRGGGESMSASFSGATAARGGDQYTLGTLGVADLTKP
jgi:hypothetical protein